MIREMIAITIMIVSIVAIIMWIGIYAFEKEIKRDSENQEKIKLCEKELPRNQTCELIAVEKQSIIDG